MPTEIPDKAYFRIGEVSELTGIKPHVLRYWESEFPLLKPPKSKTNQRLYRKRDIQTVFLLKKLLYEDCFTIAGAQAKLKNPRFRFQELGSQEEITWERDGDNEKIVEPFEHLSRDEMKSLLVALTHEVKAIRQILLDTSMSEANSSDDEVGQSGNA